MMQRTFVDLTIKVLLLFTLIPLALSVCATGSAMCDNEAVVGVEQASIEAKWGIQVLGIRSAAGGTMLDFRYRVLDAEKSVPLFDRKTKPYLIDQTNGARLLVPTAPKLGALRQTPKNPAPNKNYFILFANPGVVQPGNKVTVVVGDFKVENLIVE